QLGAWNVELVDDPKFNALWEQRREVFQRNYFEAKARAGFSTDEEVAAAANIARATVLAIERYGVVPRKLALHRLAAAFGLSKRSEFFRGLEGVEGWENLFED